MSVYYDVRPGGGGGGGSDAECGRVEGPVDDQNPAALGTGNAC
jgi:hypothetical protein